MESLINRIEGVSESMVYGKPREDNQDDIKIFAKIVFDRKTVEAVYKTKTESDIHDALFDEIKEINKMMPKYKAIRGIILTEEPLIKTTTNKIKRQENLNAIR